MGGTSQTESLSLPLLCPATDGIYHLGTRDTARGPGTQGDTLQKWAKDTEPKH